MAAFATLGCASTYSTPRTVPSGHVRHFVIADPLPQYLARIGVLPRADVGLRVGGIGQAAGVDVKMNPVRGAFDVALDPEGELVADVPCSQADAPTPEQSLACPPRIWLQRYQLPLLLGVRLGAPTTLVLVGGAALQETYDCSNAGCGYDFTPFARGGLGLNARLSRSVAIQPEANLFYAPRPAFQAKPYVLPTFGASVAFGASSEFDDR